MDYTVSYYAFVAWCELLLYNIFSPSHASFHSTVDVNSNAAYATEQILFRPDPWKNLKHSDSGYIPDHYIDSAEEFSCCEDDVQKRGVAVIGSAGKPDEVRQFVHWMEQEKPYLNPDFQLLDLRAVLPMNRTYLSRFIRDEFGCTFYKLVNRYRIDEAKRLMKENPKQTIEEIAARSGFSSRSSFTQTFTKETGLSPREWSKSC